MIMALALGRRSRRVVRLVLLALTPRGSVRDSGHERRARRGDVLRCRRASAQAPASRSTASSAPRRAGVGQPHEPLEAALGGEQRPGREQHALAARPRRPARSRAPRAARTTAPARRRGRRKRQSGRRARAARRPARSRGSRSRARCVGQRPRRRASSSASTSCSSTGAPRSRREPGARPAPATRSAARGSSRSAGRPRTPCSRCRRVMRVGACAANGSGIAPSSSATSTRVSSTTATCGPAAGPRPSAARLLVVHQRAGGVVEVGDQVAPPGADLAQRGADRVEVPAVGVDGGAGQPGARRARSAAMALG